MVSAKVLSSAIMELANYTACFLGWLKVTILNNKLKKKNTEFIGNGLYEN